MSRLITILACAFVVAIGGHQSWSQVVEGGANPSTAGTPDNPNLDATDVNPLDSRARDTDVATDPLNDPQPIGTAQPTMQSITAGQQPISQQPATTNDWRMVPHNGVWWYWTPNNTWLYYRNGEWHAYLPGDMRRQQARDYRLRMHRRYGVGYRGSAAYDSRVDANSGDNFPSGSRYQGRAGVGLGTNYSGSTFYEQRPILPTAAELQRFQQLQQSTITPFGGTSGGVQDPNLSGSSPVIGGNPIRGGVAAPGGAFSTGGVGTSATSGGTASPSPSSGTSPTSTTTPGNPLAGSTPAGGTGGAGGATGSGAASGGSGI